MKCMYRRRCTDACFRGILGQIFRWMGVDNGVLPNGTHDDADALSRVLFVVA